MARHTTDFKPVQLKNTELDRDFIVEGKVIVSNDTHPEKAISPIDTTPSAAHVAALQSIERKQGIAIYNIGTGHGYSVLDFFACRINTRKLLL